MNNVASVLICLGFVVAGAAAQEVTVSKVNLRVKDSNTWVPTSGQLWKLTGNAREHVAYVSDDGTPDVQIKCSEGDRFEAAAASLFDAPAPPPRITCRQEMVFSFTRYVTVGWKGDNSKGGLNLAAAPLVFSELTVRSLSAGKYKASAAFSDSAIASAAKLMGDDKFEQYVVRDPMQNYKLVFNEAGLEAIMAKQKAAGLKPTGALDAPTQALFGKGLLQLSENASTAFTPGVSCSTVALSKALYCSKAPGYAVGNASPPILTVPSIDVRQRQGAMQ